MITSVSILDETLHPVGTLPRVTTVQIDRGGLGKAPTLEALSIIFERDGFDFSPCWVSVDCYDQEHIPLGIYYITADSAQAEYGAVTYKATGVSVLGAALDEYAANGSYCSYGTDAAQFAAQMLQGCRGETVIHGRAIMPRTVVFGKNTSKLEAAWAVLDAVGWRIRLDGQGRKHIEPLPDSVTFVVSGLEPGVGVTDRMTYKRRYSGDYRPLDNAYVNVPAMGIDAVQRVVSQRITVSQGISVEETIGEGR